MSTHLSQMEFPTLYQMDKSISIFKGCWMVFFIFIWILIEHSVSKQWRNWSDAAICGIWCGSALFADVPKKSMLGLYGLTCFPDIHNKTVKAVKFICFPSAFLLW